MADACPLTLDGDQAAPCSFLWVSDRLMSTKEYSMTALELSGEARAGSWPSGDLLPKGLGGGEREWD